MIELFVSFLSTVLCWVSRSDLCCRLIRFRKFGNFFTNLQYATDALHEHGFIYLFIYFAEKVILHPDLEGVPLLILANKQDKLVRAAILTSLLHMCTGNDGCLSGCSTTDRGGECFWYECGVHRWQRLQDTEDLCTQRARISIFFSFFIYSLSLCWCTKNECHACYGYYFRILIQCTCMAAGAHERPKQFMGSWRWLP